MAELTLGEIAGIVQGKILNGSSNIKFTDYHFDTRLIDQHHTLFFALKSDKNDGHRFVRQLQETKSPAGVGAVVCRDFDGAGVKIPLVQVEDTLKAAHQLAAFLREKFQKIKYVGITGSAGKTTTKEFIYQILSSKYKVFRSYLNWNNWIGMPFSILKMAGDEQVGVFELAMSYPGIGEIDLLARILRPDLAVLLNAFPTHLEFLKSLENVALGKSEILNHLSSDGAAFISGDSEYLLQQCRSKKGKKIFFGRDAAVNDIILKEIIRNRDQTRLVIDFFGIETEFSVLVVNQVHIENLFAAIIVAQHLGLKNFEIQEALMDIKPLPGRGTIAQFKGFTIIDETYNSNPEALKKALHWVNQEYRGKKIAVLGDMLELGEGEDHFHREVGQFFSRLDFDVLVTVGNRAAKIAEGAEQAGFSAQNIKRFPDAREAGKFLRMTADQGSVILFKASRGIRLEEVIKEFTGE